METYVLVRFNKNTGRINKTMSATGKAMLQLWALSNTTKTTDTIIFSIESGLVALYVEGSDDFPEISRDTNEHINKYCPGLWEEMKKVVENVE